MGAAVDECRAMCIAEGVVDPRQSLGHPLRLAEEPIASAADRTLV